MKIIKKLKIKKSNRSCLHTFLFLFLFSNLVGYKWPYGRFAELIHSLVQLLNPFYAFVSYYIMLFINDLLDFFFTEAPENNSLKTLNLFYKCISRIIIKNQLLPFFIAYKKALLFLHLCFMTCTSSREELLIHTPFFYY